VLAPAAIYFTETEVIEENEPTAAMIVTSMSTADGRPVHSWCPNSPAGASYPVRLHMFASPVLILLVQYRDLRPVWPALPKRLASVLGPVAGAVSALACESMGALSCYVI